MKHAKSMRSLPIKWSLNYIAQKNVDKTVSALFASRCQKCSVDKLKLYGGVEYKILHHQFFDGKIF